jgi:glucose-6-phosphate isomerase
MTNTPAPSLRWRLSDAEERAVDALLRRAEEERVVERLHARDDTLWGPAGQAEVADRLGWLDAPADARALLPELEELAAAVEAEGFTDVVLAGMGGSSLAPEVIWRHRLQSGRTGGLRLRMIDSTDPDAVATVDAATEPRRTLVLVSTKSGGTVETLSLFRHLWDRNPDGAAFVAVTDPGTQLEGIAAEHGFRATFHGDPEIGGRFSALSPFGTVPAALCGADVAGLVDGATAALEAARQPLDENAAARLGVAIAALAEQGRDKLVLRVEDPGLQWFGPWLEQLVAESTGKSGRGLLPVMSDPVADGFGVRCTDDRQVLALRGPEPDAALEAALAQAREDGVPVLELAVGGEGDLGAAFVACEVATAVAGWGLGVNPFDQPDVQAAKDATSAVLAEVADGAPLPPAPEATPDAVLRLVDGLRAPEYLGLLAYLPPSEGAAELLGRLRKVLARDHLAAITIGFGPRYLHSTGQLHKGGAAQGRFLILQHDPRAHRPIPDAPYDFTTLLLAQAAGDERTLAARGRPVARLDLGSDWTEGLEALITAIEERR